MQGREREREREVSKKKCIKADTYETVKCGRLKGEVRGLRCVCEKREGTEETEGEMGTRVAESLLHRG